MDEQDRIQLAELRTDVKYLIQSIEEIKSHCSQCHSTMASSEALSALKDRITFGEKFIGAVILSIVGALITMAIKK